MKLITYVRMGQVGIGVIKDDGIIELSKRLVPNLITIKDQTFKLISKGLNFELADISL